MDDHTKQAVSPWTGEPDPVLRAALGKLCEELGECTAAASRCGIQGVHEVEPETKVANLHWLENEIADVLAAIEVLVERLPSMNIADARRRGKAAHFRRWHAQIEPKPPQRRDWRDHVPCDDTNCKICFEYD